MVGTTANLQFGKSSLSLGKQPIRLDGPHQVVPGRQAVTHRRIGATAPLRVRCTAEAATKSTRDHATSPAGMNFPTVEDCVGKTPLVRLQRLAGKTSNVILAKLEGNNPAGSVKDRSVPAGAGMATCLPPP